MASKNISITEKVYKELKKLKREGESFSQLFLRLIKGQKGDYKDYFGAWNLSEEELKDIWEDIARRPGRKWKRSDAGGN
ncbi:MAG: antitoxin [Promethearchaeota archaeon]|nr:MAG: antitoxin [Candidatus Lokiarchaeota archaeon]